MLAILVKNKGGFGFPLIAISSLQSPRFQYTPIWAIFRTISDIRPYRLAFSVFRSPAFLCTGKA
jgi:hypothetical protein